LRRYIKVFMEAAYQHAALVPDIDYYAGTLAGAYTRPLFSST
jgi:hypothetical protein